ncbi:DUF4190 domain-containing protein [Actinopolymorpha sp. B17G11]|uniref:DUF4190 domain-containing protein n=1 Tax=Actinopolymorpha sp. B17G11 TaxID=3160861 RepID=UPI0032E4FC2D
MSSPEERPDAADSPEAKIADELSLAPIPAEGTTAPPDAERVFARPPASSAYARIVTASAQPSGQGAAKPTDGPHASPGGDGTHRPPVHSESTGGNAGGSSGGPPGSSAGGKFGDSSGGHGAPHAPHHQPPAPPTEDEQKRIRNRGRLAILFGLTGLVASVLAFPLGLLLGIAAIVCGALARRAARLHRVPVPGATPGLVLGIVATLFASILTATAVVFWDEVVEYQQCFSGANTQTARDSCQQRLEERIIDRVGPLNTPR